MCNGWTRTGGLSVKPFGSPIPVRKLRRCGSGGRPRWSAFGMESTGHYWLGLAHWLRAQGAEVVLVQPAHVHRLKEVDDRTSTKTDAKDARVIARLVYDGRWPRWEPRVGALPEARTPIPHTDSTKEGRGGTSTLCHPVLSLNLHQFYGLNGHEAAAGFFPGSTSPLWASRECRLGDIGGGCR
jgi:hypothetical protein